MLGFYKSISQFVHYKLIHSRRIKVLEINIDQVLPKNVKTILDIGCGDGLISALLQKRRPKLTIQGLEVQKRTNCLIPCKYFNGKKIPFKNNFVDLCMLIDVLHHTSNFEALLKEATRVSRKYILIKDHVYSNTFEFNILKFMDWIGNKPYGVHLVYSYQQRQEWKNLFQIKKLSVITWRNNLPLYTFPFKYLFGRKMHMLILLKK